MENGCFVMACACLNVLTPRMPSVFCTRTNVQRKVHSQTMKIIWSIFNDTEVELLVLEEKAHCLLLSLITPLMAQKAEKHETAESSPSSSFAVVGLIIGVQMLTNSDFESRD